MKHNQSTFLAFFIFHAIVASIHNYASYIWNVVNVNFYANIIFKDGVSITVAGRSAFLIRWFC